LVKLGIDVVCVVGGSEKEGRSDFLEEGACQAPRIKGGQRKREKISAAD